MPHPVLPSRRAALLALGAGAGALLAGCGARTGGAAPGAVEALMQQHGVLRRILTAYRSSAVNLRINPAVVDVAAVGQAAGLFLDFGSDFHETAVEEALVFPAVLKAGNGAAAMIGALKDQHRRGRELNAYIRTASAGPVSSAQAEPLARALEAMSQMYEAHAAFEDTVVYPAWRAALGKSALADAGARIDRLGRARFNGPALDAAMARLAPIEQKLGLRDLAAYTAPPPPSPGQAGPDGASDAAPGADD